MYTYAVTSAQSDISSNHGLIHIAGAPPPRVSALFDSASVNSLCSQAARNPEDFRRGDPPEEEIAGRGKKQSPTSSCYALHTLAHVQRNGHVRKRWRNDAENRCSL